MQAALKQLHPCRKCLPISNGISLFSIRLFALSLLQATVFRIAWESLGPSETIGSREDILELFSLQWRALSEMIGSLDALQRELKCSSFLGVLMKTVPHLTREDLPDLGSKLETFNINSLRRKPSSSVVASAVFWKRHCHHLSRNPSGRVASNCNDFDHILATMSAIDFEKQRMTEQTRRQKLRTRAKDSA